MTMQANDASVSPAGEAAPPASSSVSVPRLALVLVGALALLGVLLSGMLWQRLSSTQEQLARQSADSSTHAVEARTMARQAQDQARDVAARLAMLDARLSEVALQRAQLEELMQSLSRSRDENLVVDIESAIRLAQQQAQLTGSVEPLLAALTAAEQRINRAAQPRLAAVQRALARDIARIKAVTVADTPALLAKLDELVRLSDELPLANAMVGKSALPPDTAAAAQEPGVMAWWQRGLQVVRDEMRGLVRVSRIDQPEAALLSPEQSFFLRENLKLKLLNARLGLLARQLDSARADLAVASTSIDKYFDSGSRKVQTVTGLLRQLQSQMKSMSLPRVDESLAALATAAAGR